MRGCAWLLPLFILTAAGCSPPVDLTTGLQIKDVSTGWYDFGIVDGKNKLVPSISFTLKDVSPRKLPVLQVQAIFRRVTENEEWFAKFAQVIGSEGLAPGATTPPITIRSERGYTAANQSREEMLSNSNFVDAEVELQAKYGAGQWTRLKKYPVTRRLLTK
jgi:hypothetical protein